MSPHVEWLAIEAAARDQVRAELAAAESTPLEVSAFVVWSECRYGRTDGLSPVHRVGESQGGVAYTTCGEAIPPAVRQMPLSPAIVRRMPHCKFCEANAVAIARETAA